MLEQIKNQVTALQPGRILSKAVSGLFRVSPYLIVGLVAFIAHDLYSNSAQVFWKTVWSFSPPNGRIYVDSPEVYTRERLINERLDEAAWLTSQLKKVNTASLPPGLVYQENLFSKLGVQGEGKASELDDTPKVDNPDSHVVDNPGAQTSDSSPSPNEAWPIPFDHEFKLKSAYRELIRQKQIENKLDDRHDLEGNSLYVLKFDTTVLSIPASEAKALVRISIDPPIYFV